MTDEEWAKHYAAGRKVTCVRGHHIGTIKEPGLQREAVARVSDITWHIANPPQRGDHVELCRCYCGAPYATMGAYGGIVLHMEDDA